jgi:Reverse transcriptase (RNA-dependent DNA polymerase)
VIPTWIFKRKTIKPIKCEINPIKNKWIFERKTNMDDNLIVYKARLVAKWFTQVEGIDYDEIFSLVAKFQSI